MFLARLFAIYLILVGLAVLSRPSNFRNMAAEFARNRGMIMVGAVITLLLGGAMVTTHNIWEGWPIIVTVIGWLTLLKGVFYLFWPDVLIKAARALSVKTYPVWGIITMLIGLYLGYQGFLA